MLPQVALQSSAVQNALMAMAGYYECGMWSKHNLKMYNLAIQHLVQGDLLQVPAITRLFCCVLFVAIEVSEHTAQSFLLTVFSLVDAGEPSHFHRTYTNG